MQVLAFPDISFLVISDEEHIYNLPKDSLKNRIGTLFGSAYNASLIEFEEETSYLKIFGFASDPKLAKKSRESSFFL